MPSRGLTTTKIFIDFMNKENAHLFLPLVQALAGGKTLQWKPEDEGPECWGDLNEIEFCMYDDPSCYRIKPEPRTFQLWINRDSGSTRSHQPADKLEWERITVQEVLG